MILSAYVITSLLDYFFNIVRYDFKVSEIMKKLRNSYELLGTIYLGPDAIPQNDTKVALHDKIFAIEKVVPLADRTEEYSELMKTEPEKSKQILIL